MKTNRIKSKQSSLKKGEYWCSNCDANKIHAGEKCSVCGYHDKANHIKKRDFLYEDQLETNDAD